MYRLLASATPRFPGVPGDPAELVEIELARGKSPELLAGLASVRVGVAWIAWFRQVWVVDEDDTIVRVVKDNIGGLSPSTEEVV